MGVIQLVMEVTQKPPNLKKWSVERAFIELEEKVHLR